MRLKSERGRWPSIWFEKRYRFVRFVIKPMDEGIRLLKKLKLKYNATRFFKLSTLDELNR